MIALCFSISSAVTTSERRDLYLRYCSRCHHPDRIGYYAPPLLPIFLKGLSNGDIERIIKEGIPSAPLKPSFAGLSNEEIKALISYLREESEEVKWTEDDIKKSLEVFEIDKGPLRVKDINDLTVVVERGRNSLWIMEGSEIIDSVVFGNVHGGIKFTSQADRFFIPSRDGWIGRYDLNRRGIFGRVRACIYMRNIALSRGEEYLMASCILPSSIVVLSPETLRPLKVFPVDGKINALYELYSTDGAVFTLRDRPLIGILDTKTLNVKYLRIEQPLDGFFIDPFEEYVIGSSRGGKRLGVYSLRDGSKVFDAPLEGMPHLFSVSWWYNKGSFYFATPHTKLPYITVWRMYDWSFIKKIETGGEGFLVRTNPNTPYLWIDNGSDELVLIDKRELSIKKLIPVKGKKVTHTEISPDGRLAYVSIYDGDGYLILYDGVTLREIKRIEARFPSGKYNFVNKSRRLDLSQLGREVFMEKCWGCHHPSHEAFGPSLSWIAKNRERALIKTFLLDPQKTYSALGYTRNVMPRIELRERELEALISFIKGSADAKDD
ncbi:MAG: dihydro-heme d1 dehydrogenase [Thermodesulfovibrionales bacterium]